MPIRVTYTDAGDYQCQINTEPKQSLDVTLVVTGIYMVFCNRVTLSYSLFSRQQEGFLLCQLSRHLVHLQFVELGVQIFY